jgi:D-3-phosphoglycerate dehydrogenase
VSNDLILVALSTFVEHDRTPLERLEQSGHPFRIHKTGKRITTPELLDEGRDAAVVVAGVEPYDAPTLEKLPNLRCISRCGVGTDAVDLEEARRRGIAVLNTPDVPTAAVAELTLAMFLSLARNLRPQANLMQQKTWKRLESHLIGGRTIGLIGLGRIGRRVAELSRAFGARVLATDPRADTAWTKATGVDIVPLDELLASSDIVSIHAARSADNPLVLGAEHFARMRRGAILVNVARGSMIDEGALLEALTSGHLAGAGLDVFGAEPYSGPLCELDQVLLTPHSATLPVETRSAMELECVDKALRFLDGTLQDGERVV